jgi:antitoxin VapB
VRRFVAGGGDLIGIYKARILHIQAAAMPLYIRDDEVDELARELQAATGASSKSEAVKQALRHELERAKQGKPLSERLKPAMDLIASIGPSDPNFDMKAYTDEMWGDI